MKAVRTGLFVVGFVVAAVSGSTYPSASDVLVAHVSGVHALEFTDAQTLISGGSDGAVKRWKLSRPAEPLLLRGDSLVAKRSVKAIRFDARTNSVWVACSGGVVEAMGLDGQSCGRFTNSSPAPINGLGFTGSGDVLAATGKWPHRTGQVMLLNPNDAACTARVSTGLEDDVLFAAVGIDDKFLIGGSRGLTLWSVQRGKLDQFAGDEVTALGFHWPSQRAIVATTTARLDAVRLQDGKVSTVRQRNDEPYTRIAVSEDSLSAASGRHVDLFQLRGDQPVIRHTLNCPADILSLALTKTRLAIGFVDGGLWIMNVDPTNGWGRIELVDNEASVEQSDNRANLQSNRVARAERERELRATRGAYWYAQNQAKIAARQAWAKAANEMAYLEAIVTSQAITGISASCSKCGCPCLPNAVVCPRGCGYFTGVSHR